MPPSSHEVLQPVVDHAELNLVVILHEVVSRTPKQGFLTLLLMEPLHNINGSGWLNGIMHKD
jgi:hypothetical protein